MAFSIVHAPGSEAGPCAEPCKHLDCQVNRRVAGHVCRLCGKPIGYGVAYTSDAWRLDGEVHLACCLVEVDRRAEAHRSTRTYRQGNRVRHVDTGELGAVDRITRAPDVVRVLWDHRGLSDPFGDLAVPVNVKKLTPA